MLNFLVFLVLSVSIASLLMIFDIARLCEQRNVIPTIIFGVIFILISITAIHDAVIFLCYHILPLTHCPALRHDVLLASFQVFILLLIYWCVKQPEISITFDWSVTP